jgi:hypothetical protein
MASLRGAYLALIVRPNNDGRRHGRLGPRPPPVARLVLNIV